MSSLPPHKVNVLDRLLPMMRAEEDIRHRFHELDEWGVRAAAERAFGKGSLVAEHLFAKRALELMQEDRKSVV